MRAILLVFLKIIFVFICIRPHSVVALNALPRINKDFINVIIMIVINKNNPKNYKQFLFFLSFVPLEEGEGKVKRQYCYDCIIVISLSQAYEQPAKCNGQ